MFRHANRMVFEKSSGILEGAVHAGEEWREGEVAVLLVDNHTTYRDILMSAHGTGLDSGGSWLSLVSPYTYYTTVPSSLHWHDRIMRYM